MLDEYGGNAAIDKADLPIDRSGGGVAAGGSNVKGPGFRLWFRR
jgi:hypothetical protein